MNEKHQTPSKVAEKWGFGMAPPKKKTQISRNVACTRFLETLYSEELPDSDVNILEVMSIVKGLFNRIVREDQWDWFTVSSQLGYPSRRISSVIANEIALFRKAIKLQDPIAFWSAKTNLLRLPARRCVLVFLGHMTVPNEPGAGWIYVLSTRELRDLLKIGMTTRTVEQRAREINHATGVAMPFGVRRCWRVSNPTKAEIQVHQVLHDFRFRKDREFFQVSFDVAVKHIDAVIRTGSLEIRTLDALAGLATTS